MRFIVRAVQERTDCIEYLRTHLPQAEWCFDQKRDAMDTFLRAMEMAGNDPCVHMEEDIFLTQDFVGKIKSAIQKRPDEVIQFFSMRQADIDIGSRYDRNFIMNQCFYLPATCSKQIFEYKNQWADIEKHPTGTDLMVNDWLKSIKKPYWLYVPSLVEHRVGKSAIDSRRSSKRQSKTFCDPV
jgi:hypothetical protein